MILALRAIAVAAITAGAAAWQVQNWRFDSILHAQQVNQRATERLRRQNSNTAAAAHETQKEKTRTEFVTITERVRDEIEVEKLVYRNVCISPGGLRELANAARATGYTGELGSTVPPDPPAK